MHHMTSIVATSLLFALCARVAAQSYTFTIVADSTLDDLDPSSMGAPSISDQGHVAFSGRTGDGSTSRAWRTGPGLQLPLTIVADEAIDEDIGTFSSNVSVNNVGQVAVWATVSTAGLDERIMRGSGGVPTTIAEAGNNKLFSFMSVIVSVNDSGTVAWQGELNQPNGPQGLFTGNGGVPNIIFSTASSNFTSSFAGPAINNAGQIAFRAGTATSGGDAIFRYDGGSTYTTIVDSSGSLSAAFDDEPAINNAGFVAVIGRSNDISTMYLLMGDGTSEAIPVVDTKGNLESINTAAINDSNQVAYSASFDDFVTQGIFTGPDLIKDRVIGTSDALDGSTVLYLSMYREGLNNSGQIAFFAQLADGRGVIVVADLCRADFDGDGFVTGLDYDLYVQAFEAGENSADFDGDEFITGIDFDLYVAAFELGC